MPRLPAVLLACALAGCGAAPMDYHSQNEIPRGPGMFTGPEGALVWRIDLGERRELDAAETDEQREFREWREWRRQQKPAGGGEAR